MNINGFTNLLSALAIIRSGNKKTNTLNREEHNLLPKHHSSGHNPSALPSRTKPIVFPPSNPSQKTAPHVFHNYVKQNCNPLSDSKRNNN